MPLKCLAHCLLVGVCWQSHPRVRSLVAEVKQGVKQLQGQLSTLVAGRSVSIIGDINSL